MAIRTDRILVRYLKIRVRKNGLLPIGCWPGCMTQDACRRNASCHMVETSRIVLCGCEVGLVAVVTIRLSCRERLPGRSMATETTSDQPTQYKDTRGRCRVRRKRVRALQWPTSRAVVELAVHKRDSVMAGRAQRRRKAQSDVIRHVGSPILSGLICTIMASIAIGCPWQTPRRRVAMAVGARRNVSRGGELVFARQRKCHPCRDSGHLGVVKSVVKKRNNVVAGGTENCREVCRNVVRDTSPQSCRLIEVRLMARDAV